MQSNHRHLRFALVQRYAVETAEKFEVFRAPAHICPAPRQDSGGVPIEESCATSDKIGGSATSE